MKSPGKFKKQWKFRQQKSIDNSVEFRSAARQYNLLPTGKRMMFGKEVKVAAKKASKVVKAFPASAIKKAI